MSNAPATGRLKLQIEEALEMMLGPDRARELIGQCLKSTDRQNVEELDRDLTLVACLIMTGQQEPSSVAAVSTAGTLRGRPSWKGLLGLGQAVIEFSHSDPMAPTTRQLVREAAAAAHQIISVLIAEER